MTDVFHIDVPYTDGALAVIALSGEFDITTAPAVRSRALDLIAAGHPDLVADLAGVTFCDSSGLGVLIGIWRCAKDANGSLTLAAIPERLDRLLSVTGMDTVLPAHPSTQTALMAHQRNRTPPENPSRARPASVNSPSSAPDGTL
ncbi:STAS domain-containing protein [Streptomyces sp. NBC_01174]|uniref:STAS domain-containing protein n=1 Tax=Streptomyces sp. NBC_01174 TaxID=2903758 RepID=UPI00386D4EF6|nr:STAS domain-containing protein [Streptomyces sp. NBC_01177]WSS73184.1 STAS domain-containing protein [Streptomyces sp. NBC_01175]WSS80216.1 STAS domain-containing protein [Streptomyces sp. NBC_01174]